MPKSKSKWRLVTEFPILSYKCSAVAGEKVRLKRDLTIHDHRKRPKVKITRRARSGPLSEAQPKASGIFGLYGTAPGGGNLTDLHYCGHGSKSSLGSPLAGITLNQLKNSKLSKSPLVYAAIDGCRTGENADMLQALIGHSVKSDRNKFKNKGWTPRFAWGWKDAKAVQWVLQGELYHKHFEFVGDYYWFLTQRDFSGYLSNPYDRAINYGQHPNNPMSPSGGRYTRNAEGDSINYVGCFDCLFDE